MSVNKLTAIGEFERGPEKEHWETELKLTPIDPHSFDFMKTMCEVEHIEQIYLSRPDEPYNLRVRKVTDADGTVRYTAALKTQSRFVPHGHRRLETPTEISAEAFARYQATEAPRVFKQRVHPVSGVTIDWIEGYDTPIIEIEDVGIDPDAQLFYQEFRSVLDNRTEHPEVDNEWIAHHLLNHEIPEYKQETVEEMTTKILGYRDYGVSPVIVTIDGRSGSGKSTVARELKSKLELVGRVRCVILSTDNYNRGKEELDALNAGEPWTNFDVPEVYDTKSLADNVARLRAGEPIENRLFSFRDEAYRYEGMIRPADVIIIEGIYAGTKDLHGLRHFHFPVTTSVATSIGRDIDRFRENKRPNGSIKTTGDRLRYQLEIAEPAFLQIDRVDDGQLRRFRNTVGRKVVQVSGGKVVTRPKSSEHPTPEPLD